MHSQFMFIALRWLDVLDILLVALLLYQLYHLIKGTAAIRIFVGILLILVIWRFTVALQMELVSSILGQFIGIGVIAVIIIFQPEIRTFLIRLGSNKLWQSYFKQRNWKIPLFQDEEQDHSNSISTLSKVAFSLSQSKTGALIILQRKHELLAVIETGQTLNAQLSSQLLSSIFQKNSPLHDGATICSKSTVIASGCQLPLSNRESLQKTFGMRHRAAAGLTEQSDALAIVVSEETGTIHTCLDGLLFEQSDETKLNQWLTLHWITT